MFLANLETKYGKLNEHPRSYSLKAQWVGRIEINIIDNPNISTNFVVSEIKLTVVLGFFYNN